MNIKLVEAFVLLMRSGSFASAEREAGVPRATLSRQLAQLEAELGTQLLARTSRRVTPTENGRAFFVHAQQLLAEVQARLDAARTELQERSDGTAGELALLTDTHFSTSFLCDVVRRFAQAHPGVRCTLDVAGRADAPALDRVDCYLCTVPPDQPNWVAKPLGRLGSSLFASPAYLRRCGRPAHPSELARHAAAVLGDAAPVRLHARDASVLWQPQAAARSNDYWVLKTFCLDGFGVALLPDFFARPEVASGALVPVLPGWHPEPLRVYAAYRKQRYMGGKLRSFIAVLGEAFHEIDTLGHYVGSARAAANA